MSLKTARTLIISPHIDDEVLGCFCWLGKHTHVVYCGVEERPDVSASQRLQEARSAADLLGFEWTLLEGHIVNRYVASALISQLESAITRLQPERVLIPEPSYNQDHRATYDAALVATRPHDRLPMVSSVLLYEQPHSVIWPHELKQRMTPNVFVPIDIEKKLAAYACYASQVRGHRSPATLQALARLRGAMINHDYAEGFHALRILEQVQGQ